jgi:hypothetical protein
VTPARPRGQYRPPSVPEPRAPPGPGQGRMTGGPAFHEMELPRYIAELSRSPVQALSTLSTGLTQILPSPIDPVFALWRWRSRTRQRTHPGRQYRPGLRQHSRIPGGTDRAAVPVLLDEANNLGGGPAARPGRGYRGHQVVTVAEKGAERCPPSRCYLQRVIMLPRRGSCPAGGPGSAGRRGVSGPVPGLLALPVPRRGVHHEATSKALRRARGSGGPRSRARSMPRR